MVTGLPIASLASAVLASAAFASSIRQWDDTSLLQSQLSVQEWSFTNSPFWQPLINFGDVQYVTHLKVGKQLISGIIDTGSSELTILKSNCGNCGPTAHYDPQRSDTYAAGQLEVQQHFGSSSTRLTSGQDEVSMGPFLSHNQSFWSIQAAELRLDGKTAFEAIVGLGPPESPVVEAWRTATTKVQELANAYDEGVLPPMREIDSVKESIHVAMQVARGSNMLRVVNCTGFSICLKAQPGSDGAIIWNDDKTREMPRTFSSIPVLEDGTWSANLTKVELMLPRHTTPLGCPNGCTARIDSSSSLLAVPRDFKQAIEEAAAHLSEDCSNLDELPAMVFQLGQARIYLPPQAYVANVTGKAPHAVLERLPDLSGQNHRCRLMLMESDDLRKEGEPPLWVLGLPFFRRYYTAFNLGGNGSPRTVSIAPHSGDCSLQPHRTAMFSRVNMASEVPNIEAEFLQLPQRRSPVPTLRRAA